MKYNELFITALALNQSSRLVDRIHVAEYQDENGAIAWRDIKGTYTDDKGRRFTVTACNCMASRDFIELTLNDMRNEQDFEFCVKYELITIRG